jgi:predicted nucleotidyltransferase component of viral defense system
MAKKREMSDREAFELRQAAQIATLQSLLNSRRWEPGDLVFHGGTSLNIVHGSPRFSEDLDFMISDGIKIGSITQDILARMPNGWLARDLTVSIERERTDNKMHSFVVAIGGPNVMGKVRVKIELWRTSAEILRGLQLQVSPVRFGNFSVTEAFVQSCNLREIKADKVFAQGGRPYLKARDIFDLYWLEKSGESEPITPADMDKRFAIYEIGNPDEWVAKASARKDILPGSAAQLREDIEAWLPSSWPISDTMIKNMIECSVQAIDEGIKCVADLKQTPSPDCTP